jgi:hypothetical protein
LVVTGQHVAVHLHQVLGLDPELPHLHEAVLVDALVLHRNAGVVDRVHGAHQVQLWLEQRHLSLSEVSR